MPRSHTPTTVAGGDLHSDSGSAHSSFAHPVLHRGESVHRRLSSSAMARLRSAVTGGGSGNDILITVSGTGKFDTDLEKFRIRNRFRKKKDNRNLCLFKFSKTFFRPIFGSDLKKSDACTEF
jgi:hypothetical protein